ncbi:MAG: hypothetical protein AB9897_02655 [Anaerolineaceae bacterium]
MPSPKDFEIARLLGWYRIPMRLAPKIVDVDYLAFYQTNAFGIDHRWQIETFAPVTGHELTTRRELIRDEPNHPRANEEYYKIQIGPLQRINQPISAEKWKRITFLYTIGSLFNQAVHINDLVVKSDERALLWKSLRERAARAESYGNHSESEGMVLDPMILKFLGGFGEQESLDDDFLEI